MPSPLLAGPLSSPASAETDMYCHDLRASRETDLNLGAWYGWAANVTGGDWGLNLMAGHHYLEAMETGDAIAQNTARNPARSEPHARDGVEEETVVHGDLVRMPGQHQLLGFSVEPELMLRLVTLRCGVDFDEYG